MREIINALVYKNRTGCQWQLLPHDLPWSAVYYYFKLWRDDGTDRAVHDLLRSRCGRRPAGPRIRPPSCWTPSRSVPRTTSRRPRQAKTRRNECLVGSGDAAAGSLGGAGQGRGRPGQAAWYRPDLSARQKAVNRAHARIRARGERTNDTLKTWKVLTKLRCCPRPSLRDRAGNPRPTPRRNPSYQG